SAFVRLKSDTPWLEARGLHLRSTATRCLCEERPLWLHSATHRALLTRGPSLSSVPDKERCSTENIFPRHGVLAWNPAHVQLERKRIGEPSLCSSSEEEGKCL